MSAARGNAPAPRGAAAPAQQGGWQKTAGSIVQSLALMFTVQMVMKYGMQYLGYGPQTPAQPATPSVPGVTGTTPAPAQPGVVSADPAWPLGTPFSMLLFTSTSPTGADLNYGSPLLVWDGLTYGGWKDDRQADLDLTVPRSIREGNGTWWMDVVLVKGGGDTVFQKPPGEVALYRKQLTRFMPKRRVRKEKKLIGGSEEEDETETAESHEKEIVAHWSRNLTLNVVGSGDTVNMASLGPHMVPYYQLVPPPTLGPDENGSMTVDESAPKTYYPPVFPNDFWLLRENLWPINATDTTLPLHVTYSAISGWKFQLFSTMSISFEQAAAQQGGAEMDEVKRMLTETSPWLLITTAIVTVLHTVFEFLAFSSDIGHWRKKDKDLVGVSLRTILTNCFVQLVILLYLQDSSEETSFMILFGQGIGLLIEAWKITKVVNVRVREAPGTLIGYQITFEDKRELSEEEKQTQQYDKEAFKIVSYFAIPMLGGYTIYSLLYETHRGWYSFIITTLAQAIYMFGFVQLVPQLIINYKLKSVAHMPMKAMMYKTLSTVIDDFFAFCVRMPWLHRLACFRDDVVFLVLLYQRWIYRVDYSRVNEFGQVQEGMAEPVGDKDKAAAIETKKTQ